VAESYGESLTTNVPYDFVVDVTGGFDGLSLSKHDTNTRTRVKNTPEIIFFANTYDTPFIYGLSAKQ
jgi:hypothetical protein